MLKGTVAWDFLSKVISTKVPNWSSVSWSKAVSNVELNSPRNSTFNVFSPYGPLWQILLCAMGHYSEFGCAQWATAADWAKWHGPLQRIWFCAMDHCVEISRTVKICIDFCAKGNSAGYGYELWAIAQGLVIRYCNGWCGGDVCGPWGKGSHLGSRGSKGTWPVWRGKRRAVGIGQWRRIDGTECLRTEETGSPQHQATFMHRVCIIVHYVNYHINSHNRNRVWLYYLFQENKSFGSKKPFAFILWCTGSCIEHSYEQ